MSETWFIGDTHFYHENILIYEPYHRPFVNIEKMNEAIIERWNNVVGKYDKVYHLGDFSFNGKSKISIASRLNGQKRLILGNHDSYPPEEYLKYFKSIHGVLFWNDCILTHVPVHPNELLHRSTFNIHGHKHSKHVLDENGLKDKRYINVSCEQNNLTPINADQLLIRIRDESI